MSKISRRPNREEIKKTRKEAKKAQQALRNALESEGMKPFAHSTISNCKCPCENVEEEKAARTEIVADQVRIFQSQLPLLLKRLSKIPDPRNPKKLKHKMTVLMLYGILCFVYQMASRREANREMTRPMFMKNLKMFFPELEALPHHDTLNRLLSRIDVCQIESAHIELVRRLIRNKKFYRYLISQCYPISIDGTQKFTRDHLWSEECSERKKNGSEEEKSYYVYVLEANLTFHNGMSIPLMTEILKYTEGDTANSKQDCETKAFYRLAERLKREFPRLCIMILIDGLYANGPIIECCRENKWQFMIVLKDKKLKNAWNEYEGLKALEVNNILRRTWGNRKQYFQWVNEIEYFYGPNQTKNQKLHVVVCEENWQEVENGVIVTKNSRHAWISSDPLNKRNVHERCNLGARHRWGIESGILVEKQQGYQYEHCFSYDWNAMTGYHYLMRLGHLFNVLIEYSECFVKAIKDMGVRGLIHFIRQTMSAPWFDDPLWVKERLSVPIQIRFI